MEWMRGMGHGGVYRERIKVVKPKAKRPLDKDKVRVSTKQTKTAWTPYKELESTMHMRGAEHGVDREETSKVRGNGVKGGAEKEAGAREVRGHGWESKRM